MDNKPISPDFEDTTEQKLRRIARYGGRIIFSPTGAYTGCFPSLIDEWSRTGKCGALWPRTGPDPVTIWKDIVQENYAFLPDSVFKALLAQGEKCFTLVDLPFYAKVDN